MWCGGYKYIRECNLLRGTPVKCFDTLTLHFSRKVFDWIAFSRPFQARKRLRYNDLNILRNAVNESNKRKSLACSYSQTNMTTYHNSSCKHEQRLQSGCFLLTQCVNSQISNACAPTGANIHTEKMKRGKSSANKACWVFLITQTACI